MYKRNHRNKFIQRLSYADLLEEIEDLKAANRELRKRLITPYEAGLIYDCIKCFKQNNIDMSSQYDIDFFSIERKIANAQNGNVCGSIFPSRNIQR